MKYDTDDTEPRMLFKIIFTISLYIDVAVWSV